jgi:hypothetical protein
MGVEGPLEQLPTLTALAQTLDSVRSLERALFHCCHWNIRCKLTSCIAQGRRAGNSSPAFRLDSIYEIPSSIREIAKRVEAFTKPTKNYSAHFASYVALWIWRNSIFQCVCSISSVD